MPAQSEKQRGLMGIVHSIQQGEHPTIRKNKEKVMQMAREMEPSSVKHFLKKDCDSEEMGVVSPNKTKYSGTPPLSPADKQFDMDEPAISTTGDLIDPDDTSDVSKVVKTIELPDKMIKKFLYLIRDTSHKITEAQFNGQAVTLYKPFKLKKHPTKKYGIYIQSARDGQIIKVLFGTSDMFGDPLRKKKK